VLLAAARVMIQLVHPIPIWLGAVAVAGGLVVMPSVVAAVRRADGDTALLTGVVLGLALDTAIRGGFLTWDLAWQEGPTAMGVAVGVGVLAILAAVTLPLETGSLQPPALRLALFGPFFALQLLFLQNTRRRSRRRPSSPCRRRSRLSSGATPSRSGSGASGGHLDRCGRGS
jgi:hypothetical protein